jgi:hypothetical protein
LQAVQTKQHGCTGTVSLIACRHTASLSCLAPRSGCFCHGHQDASGCVEDDAVELLVHGVTYKME